MKKPIGTRIMGWMALLVFLVAVLMTYAYFTNLKAFGLFGFVALYVPWGFFWFCFMFWGVASLVHRKRLHDARALSEVLKQNAMGFSPGQARTAAAPASPLGAAPAASADRSAPRTTPRGVQTGPLNLK